MAKLKKKLEQEEPIPMSPMIDMVFLLLVFFMCVSTVAKSAKSLELDLAESDTAPVPEDSSDRGIISIDAEGNIYIGENQLTLDQMQETIRKQLQRNPKLKISVRAAYETEFRHISRALKACSEVGAYDIIYSTFQTAENARK